METARAFEISQTINERLANMVGGQNTTEANRNAMASEIRQLVTELCLAVIENNAGNASRELQLL